MLAASASAETARWGLNDSQSVKLWGAGQVLRNSKAEASRSPTRARCRGSGTCWRSTDRPRKSCNCDMEHHIGADIEPALVHTVRGTDSAVNDVSWATA